MRCGFDTHTRENIQDGCGQRFDWETAPPYRLRIGPSPGPKPLSEDIQRFQARRSESHGAWRCDLCHQSIAGLRFSCVHCPSFDCCTGCEPRLAAEHQTGHVFEIHEPPVPDAAACSAAAEEERACAPGFARRLRTGAREVDLADALPKRSRYCALCGDGTELGFGRCSRCGRTQRLWTSFGGASSSASAAPSTAPPAATRAQSAAAGDQTLTFGKHDGKTFEQVRSEDPGYCDWARSKSEPSGDLRNFVEWLRRVDGDRCEGTRIGGAASSAHPATVGAQSSRARAPPAAAGAGAVPTRFFTPISRGYCVLCGDGESVAFCIRCGRGGEPRAPAPPRPGRPRAVRPFFGF